jgi:uncharacterized membrane protein YobD (UPF0266 family)
MYFKEKTIVEDSLIKKINIRDQQVLVLQNENNKLIQQLEQQNTESINSESNS